MENNAKQLIKQGDYLYEKKRGYDNLCQSIAENFYVERADFTQALSLDDEFADQLTTSYPLMAHRDLSNAFGAMLRPSDREWFHVTTTREDRQDNEAKRWLEWATQVQRRAMYDRAAQFTRATKEGDKDYAAFGQCVISTELDRINNTLLYRCWHIRDMAWCDNYQGKTDTIHRKWKPTASTLSQIFKDRIHPKVKEKLDKDPYCEFNCRHIIVPADQYSEPGKDSYGTMPTGKGSKKWRTPYVSIHIDVDNKHVMEEMGVWNTVYSIPKWASKSGSQYAYSPATIVSLPDARLLQAITLTLLEAGEKSVNPPLVATEQVIRSDIQAYAGGVTWVDAAYDERLGDALRPMTIDKSGLNFGLGFREDIRQMLTHGMFLNQLRMPQVTKEMTAFETSQVVQEYIRQALPVIEPTESDYNGSITEITFDTLLRGGGFGSPYDIPESIRNAEIQFKFESPLRDAAEKEKAQIFLETKGMMAEAAQIDPNAARILDVLPALRDVMAGIKTPSKWILSEENMEKVIAETDAQKRTAEIMAGLQSGGAVAEQVGKGAQAIKEAM